MLWYASFVTFIWSLALHPGALDGADGQMRGILAAAPNRVAAMMVVVAERPAAVPTPALLDTPAERVEACPACPIAEAAANLPPVAAVREGMIWPDVGEAEPAPPPDSVVERQAPADEAVALDLLEAEMDCTVWWQPECMPWVEPTPVEQARVEAPQAEQPTVEEAAAEEAKADEMKADAAEAIRDTPVVTTSASAAQFVRVVRDIMAEMAGTLQRAIVELQADHLQRLQQDRPAGWRYLN